MEYNLFEDVVPAGMGLVKLGAMVAGMVCVLPLIGVLVAGRYLCQFMRW